MSPLAGDGDVPEHATTEPGPDKVNKHRFRRGSPPGPQGLLRGSYTRRGNRDQGDAVQGLVEVWRGRRSRWQRLTFRRIGSRAARLAAGSTWSDAVHRGCSERMPSRLPDDVATS